MAGTGPGPENLPAQGPELFSPFNFAEFVRRALHAAADQVEPRRGRPDTDTGENPGEGRVDQGPFGTKVVIFEAVRAPSSAP